MTRTLDLDREGAAFIGDAVDYIHGFGDEFAVVEFGGTAVVGDVSQSTPLNLDLEGTVVPHLRLVRLDTEPTLLRILAGGIAVPLEGNVDSLQLRIKSRSTGALVIDRSVDVGQITDTNGVLLLWNALDWDTIDTYWLELEIVFTAGYQTTYRNRGKALVEVESELAA